MADGRHPADLAPADNILAFDEVNNYSEAWLAGQTWSKEPTNIPIAYVTRAAFLWFGGESYVFTNSPPTNAPLWWVNVPPLSSPAAGSNHVSSTLPASLSENLPFLVNLLVTPAEAVLAHAVEDQIPDGWSVLDISHGGNLDDVNHKVKWGPFYDNGERDLYYVVQPADGEAGSFTFAGAGSFDGRDVTIAGARLLVLGDPGQPLRFVACAVDAQGPKFTLAGEPLCAVAVEVSTNLVNWAPLLTVTTDAQGAALFRPENPGLAPYRFYRLRLEP